MKSLIVMALIMIIDNINCLYFNLQKGTLRCFLDEAPAETHIVAYYEILDKLEKDQGIIANVYHSDNNTLIYKTTLQNKKGKYSFVPHVSGSLKFCYQTTNSNWVYENEKIRFGIRHSIGQSSIDTKDLVKNVDLQNIQKSARKLYSSIKNFVNSQIMEVEVEDQIFDQIQRLADNISRITIFQIIVILLAGVFQIYSLRKFFIQKKIA